MVFLVCVVLSLFFFKQKTAYEMRISDWSSDVCSSDLCWRTSPKVSRRPTIGRPICRAGARSHRSGPICCSRTCRLPWRCWKGRVAKTCRVRRRRRMSARSLFEIATGIEHKARRTFQPVRRNSYNVGEREGRFWRPVNPRNKWAHIRAAESYDRERKQPGKRNGPLGHIAIELLRELYRIVDYKTGRLDPSIGYLMRQLRRSRAATVHALARLKEHGFLEWIRLHEPTGTVGFGDRMSACWGNSVLDGVELGGGRF